MSTREFGPYPYNGEGIPTVEDSYEDGFNTGLTWEASYIPGGPYVHEPGQKENDEEWVAYCTALKENHDAWHRGFRDACVVSRNSHNQQGRG